MRNLHLRGEKLFTAVFQQICQHPEAMESLPEPVSRVLSGFVESAKAALGTDLVAIVLFGSAAEGKLRKTSDVNVIVVLAAFDPKKVDPLREPLRTAHSAIKLEAMFLLNSESLPRPRPSP